MFPNEFEATVTVREIRGANTAIVGMLATAFVGVAVVLAFGPRPDHGPIVHPASAISSATTTEKPTTPPKPGCWMLCDEPPLPPMQDTRGCRLFCELGMAPTVETGRS